ncbi:hypothetical protein [Salsuginibacillus kocurii]|uniref:hypothetical protein n=1 Tax=Salsuginibacillus kocurii TaxID=427078 RepID=UPI00035C652A|nr:hypothetical protein [Salsuginibacillus kocurii]
MKHLLIFFLLLLAFTPSAHVYADELMEAFAIRVYVETAEGDTYQWSFDNPNTYEYQHNDRVIRGESAEKKVTQMYEQLDISENHTSESLSRRIIDGPFPTAEKIDVRYRNGESQLFTWLWEKKVD